MLRRMAAALKAVGRGSSEETLERIRAVVPSIDLVLRQILERAPRAVLRVVTDVALELSERTGDLALVSALAEAGTDPRNFREAVTTLEQLQAHVKDTPLEPQVDRALQVLEERGALGLSHLEKLGAFFVSVKRRPGLLSLRQTGQLQVGDAHLDIDRLIQLRDALSSHSVMWGRRAAFDALNEKFGVDLEALEWERLEGTLPGGFASMDAIAALRPWRMARLPRSPTEIDQDNARKLYFGLHVLNSLMLPQWWNRFQPDLVFDATTDETRYDPVRRSLVIGRAAAPLSGLIEALIEAADANLVDYQGFASETLGHPAALFTGLLEPLYGPMPPRKALARFIEHYLRIYMNQIGERYAPLEHEGDPAAARVATLSKTFMDMWVEAQQLDLADEIEAFRSAEQHNVGAGGIGAGVLVLLGAGIFP